MGVLSPMDVPTPPRRPNMKNMSMTLPGRPRVAPSPIMPAQAAETRRIGRPRFQ